MIAGIIADDENRPSTSGRERVAPTRRSARRASLRARIRDERIVVHHSEHVSR
jgi:hypothetical protein